MTTTRPYRKALSVEEALKRLGDAAGTQLQEDLVVAFIKGIETAADAPLPGEIAGSHLASAERLAWHEAAAAPALSSPGRPSPLPPAVAAAVMLLDAGRRAARPRPPTSPRSSR